MTTIQFLGQFSGKNDVDGKARNLSGNKVGETQTATNPPKQSSAEGLPFIMPSVLFSGAKKAQEPTLKNMFYPKSVAVIGASPVSGTIGQVVMDNILSGGYKGKLYPVNPKYGDKDIFPGKDTVATCVASVDKLPENAIDMAVIMSPKQTVPATVKTLGEKGVKSVVVISAGFNESGADGQTLETSLKSALDGAGMKMIGPNCVGVASTGGPLGTFNATFVSGEVTPGPGAVMSQSGAVAIDLIQQARLAGLGFSQIASIGNKTDIDDTQLIAHWGKDPNVKYILGYLESIKSPEEFRKVASTLSKTKPIVLLKAGKSSAGAKAASSHTGSLAGNDTAVEALFAQSGVQRVNSINELFAVAKAFELAPPLKGNRVGILSNSGGYGVMVADMLEGDKVEPDVAQLTDATRATLKKLLPPAASNSNPVDTIATTPSDSPENFKQSVLAMANDPNVDAVVVGIVPLLNINALEIGRILADVQSQTDKPVFGVLSVSEAELLSVQKTLASEAKAGGKKVPVLYRNLEDAMTGMTALERHRLWSAKPSAKVRKFTGIRKADVKKILDDVRSEKRTLLTTTESLKILEAYGIKVASYFLAEGKDKADIKNTVMARACELGYPVAIKLVSKTISHKTDVGGVAFDIKTAEDLSKAYDTMMASLEKAGVKEFAPGEGIMIQQFVPKGRETLIGFKEDPAFGKMVAFGLGGIYVEIFKDALFRLAPLTEADADEMMHGIKAVKILTGYRGKPAVDLETLKDVILRYSQLTQDFPELAESDINPYFAQPKEDGGGIAVDARFELRRP